MRFKHHLYTIKVLIWYTFITKINNTRTMNFIFCEYIWSLSIDGPIFRFKQIIIEISITYIQNINIFRIRTNLLALYFSDKHNQVCLFFVLRCVGCFRIRHMGIHYVLSTPIDLYITAYNFETEKMTCCLCNSKALKQITL